MTYSANLKKWTETGHITPAVEKYPGERLNIHAMPAPYIPLMRYDEKHRDWKVISAGTPVSLDSNGYIVPSGYALDRANEVASSTGVITYSSNDVDYGIYAVDGTLAADAEKVTTTLISEGITISKPIGFLAQDAYVNSSDDYDTLAAKPVGMGGVDPTRDRYHGNNPQHRLSIVCDWVMEFPVVDTSADWGADDPPFPGIALIDSSSTDVTPGCFLKVDAYSRLVVADTATDSFFDILGQVVLVDKTYPKGYLDRVRTQHPLGGMFDATDGMPGTSSEGYPDNITYAGGETDPTTALVNLMFR